MCLGVSRGTECGVISRAAVLPGPQLTSDAAEDLRRDHVQFQNNVKRAMGGGSVGGVTFDRVLIK